MNLGEVAPDFTLRDQHGAEVRIGAFRGVSGTGSDARGAEEPIGVYRGISGARDDGSGAEEPVGAYRGVSGPRNVVLVFYPYAFTGVCTSELAELQKRLPEFEALSAAVLAVSCDSMFSLRVFADREGLTFPLLSDFWPHGAVASAYGVFDSERGCALRGTFVLDQSGAVRWQVVNQLPDARDPEEYLAVLAGL